MSFRHASATSIATAAQTDTADMPDVDMLETDTDTDRVWCWVRMLTSTCWMPTPDLGLGEDPDVELESVGFGVGEGRVSGVPSWVVGDPGWLGKAGLVPRVTRLEDAGSGPLEWAAVLERTTLNGGRRPFGVAREVHVGRPAVLGVGGKGKAAVVAGTGVDDVGFVLTIPVGFKPGGGYVGEVGQSRSPLDLARQVKSELGARADHARVVIGLNAWNDPRDTSLTTADVEARIAREVDEWQTRIDAELPGLVTVAGYVLEPPVYDTKRDGTKALIDPDLLRTHLYRNEAGPVFAARYPFAGVREGMITSRATLERMRELKDSHSQVFLHIGDGDPVSYKPTNHDTSIFEHYAHSIASTTTR